MQRNESFSSSFYLIKQTANNSKEIKKKNGRVRTWGKEEEAIALAKSESSRSHQTQRVGGKRLGTAKP